MSILSIAIGFIILIAGRQTYPLFVGGASFLGGVYLAQEVYKVQPEWNIMVFGLLFGVFGFLVTYVIKRWAARLAAFIVGCFLFLNLPSLFGTPPEWMNLITSLVGGGLAFILALIWFDISVVLLSTLTGVTMILQHVKPAALDVLTMFIALVVFGLITQYVLLQYGKPHPD